jgi:hypothetical protein
MFRQASPECYANQVLLKTDLNDAMQSMKTVAQALCVLTLRPRPVAWLTLAWHSNTPEVETAENAITATMQNLAVIAGMARFGRELDQNYGSWMMNNASLARTMIDEIFGVYVVLFHLVSPISRCLLRLLALSQPTIHCALTPTVSLAPTSRVQSS